MASQGSYNPRDMQWEESLSASAGYAQENEEYRTNTISLEDGALESIGVDERSGIGVFFGPPKPGFKLYKVRARWEFPPSDVYGSNGSMGGEFSSPNVIMPSIPYQQLNDNFDLRLWSEFFAGGIAHHGQWTMGRFQLDLSNGAKLYSPLDPSHYKHVAFEIVPHSGTDGSVDVRSPGFNIRAVIETVWRMKAEGPAVRQQLQTAAGRMSEARRSGPIPLNQANMADSLVAPGTFQLPDRLRRK